MIACKSFDLLTRKLNHSLSAVTEILAHCFSWSAIVRGAAFKGLDNDGVTAVNARKCRRHYGVCCSVLFKPGVHREADSYQNEYRDMKYASNQINWIIGKGEELQATRETHGSIRQNRLWWKSAPRVAEITLLAFDADKAPSRASAQVSTPNNLIGA
jgi:hypothetical protein